MTHYSQRIGSKTKMTSDFPADPQNFSYAWTSGGTERNGVTPMVCSGCRSIRSKKEVPKETKLPTRKAADGNRLTYYRTFWIRKDELRMNSTSGCWIIWATWDICLGISLFYVPNSPNL